jgi:AhpD family alkylhydroperoxidase
MAFGGRDGAGYCGYCFNRHGAELVAAPVPEAELLALAAWLPLA